MVATAHAALPNREFSEDDAHLDAHPPGTSDDAHLPVTIAAWERARRDGGQPADRPSMTGQMSTTGRPSSRG